MAGFEDLIRGTLQKHEDSTPQSRTTIYDSSRQALERMLSQNQNLDLTAQSLQRQRLEKAIADIEASYTVGAPMSIGATTSANPVTPVAPVPSKPSPVASSQPPPPIPVFNQEPTAPPPQSPPSLQPQESRKAPLPQPAVSPVGGADAYSEAVAASEGNEPKPYAKLLLWTIIVVGFGVAIWWAINFGPALLKQQLGGSVPNPSQTIESGQFISGDGRGEGWVTAFDPANDSINIETGGRGSAEVFQNDSEAFVRLASNAGGNDNNLKILIPRGVMLPLKRSAATIEVIMKSSVKASQEFAIYCEFGSMGSCGRKRFTASDRPDAQIFDVLLNNVGLSADEDAYLSFNTDLGGEGRAIDIYGIRVRLNR